jgi:hypothetical protein
MDCIINAISDPQLGASHTDYARVIIYDCKINIIQDTGTHAMHYARFCACLLLLLLQLCLQKCL